MGKVVNLLDAQLNLQEVKYRCRYLERNTYNTVMTVSDAVNINRMNVEALKDIIEWLCLSVGKDLHVYEDKMPREQFDDFGE